MKFTVTVSKTINLSRGAVNRLLNLNKTGLQNHHISELVNLNLVSYPTVLAAGWSKQLKPTSLALDVIEQINERREARRKSKFIKSNELKDKQFAICQNYGHEGRLMQRQDGKLVLLSTGRTNIGDWYGFHGNDNPILPISNSVARTIIKNMALTDRETANRLISDYKLS